MIYFAYGSNLSFKRLRSRLPSARLLSTAYLTAHRLCFHKIGMDGSGKCDAFYTGDEHDVVLGALYRIEAEEKKILETSEGEGYEEKEVTVFSASGEKITAFTFLAKAIDERLRPFHWYKGHVLIGARENRFPDEYVERFLSVESVDDPDKERAERELGLHGLGRNAPLRSTEPDSA